MTDTVIQTVQDRYHRITKRINTEYWSTDSDTSHSLYVGSYGRGTAIFTSDIDIVVELPWSIFSKYDNYTGNGQSALLQDVREVLKKSYSSSQVSADGQVIDIDFYDGVKFEVVPAFAFDDGRYYYPDTNNGGSWKCMNPRAEIESIKTLNNKLNGNVRNFARMIRSWNQKKSVLLPGYLIDASVYRFLLQYEYSDKSFSYYDWMSRDYFQYMIDNSVRDYWVFPGSLTHAKAKYPFRSDAVSAHQLALDAIEAYSGDDAYTWHSKWRDIYGTKFPSA